MSYLAWPMTYFLFQVAHIDSEPTGGNQANTIDIVVTTS